MLRGDIVKDASGSYPVFTEEGSSASQKTAAKVMDVIARMPDCAGQAADAVSVGKVPNWELSICSAKRRLIFVGTKNGWKKTKLQSCVEETHTIGDIGEPTSFLDHEKVGCTQRDCKSIEIIVDEGAKPNLDNVRRLRDNYFIDPEDGVNKDTTKNAWESWKFRWRRRYLARWEHRSAQIG